jgi:uncharacterized protein YlbG (UPF0298 family)
VDMREKRQGLVVWLHSIKHAKSLRKFGNVHYVSKRLKYVILYCDADDLPRITEKLESFSFIKKIEPSYKPFLKLEFETKQDKAKEYDYKTSV